jgi:hypothetical protein
VSCIIYNEQTVRPVIVADEFDDEAFELMLSFRTDVQLNDVGVIVKAVAEEGIEFSGLVLVRW